MSNLNTQVVAAGTVVELNSTVELEDGTMLVLNPSRPSKQDALKIGLAYYTAAAEGNERAMDNYLEELGGVLVKRGLKTFANFVLRNEGRKDVANAALELRNEISKAKSAVA